MRLLQAIDVGSNTVRSVVVEVPVGGPHRVIDDERAMTKLGRGLETTGMLDPEAVEESVSALKTMIKIGRNLGANEVHAIATEAVRRASNGQELLDRLREEAGLEVEVVSEEEEGRLVWLSAASMAKDMPFAVVLDIGGGSVEVIQAVRGEPASIVSLPIGARFMTERFVTGDPVADKSFKALKRHIRRSLRGAVTPLEPGVPSIIGSGGTVSAIAAMVGGLRGKRYESLQGVEISRADVMQLLGILSHSTAEQRLAMPGASADRSDIILAGTLVLAEVMKLFGASKVLVNARGIREGIVLDALLSDGAITPVPDTRQAVRDLGHRYRYDRDHAEQVARLATDLFDQLSQPLGLDPSTRPLLEAAATLHDIGYYISYDRHHKHSHHLILHSGLPGFTQRQLAIIAAVGRYHTKALPKRSHPEVSSLEPKDRALVRTLAAILRIADGLDRGRGGRIISVKATDDGSTTRLDVAGAEDLHAELYGVDKKKDLYEEVFGRRVVVVVEGGGGS
jgi:exopolyphosphatase/guanosine-5'-triphosphate,3'-diphosphate pyrophosphatase